VESPDYDATFGPTEPVEGRRFADPVYTSRDAKVMQEMLVRERATASVWMADGTSGPWVRKYRKDRRNHWLAVPDTAGLVGARDVTAVGFFGQRREDVNHAALFAVEEEVVDGLPDYAGSGFLSYYNMQLPNGRHGNLVLFGTPDVPKGWYANPVHERAVAIAPRHYHSARLHKGRVPGPLLGDGELTIERTRYFDFDGDRPWLGLRLF
jgi:hypothetical protein